MPSAVQPRETTSKLAHNRAAHRPLIDAVMREHVGLTLRSRSSVASHGRKDERLRSLPLPVIDNRLHDFRNVVDSPAAHAYGNTSAWLQILPEPSGVQLRMDLAGDILYSAIREVLPDQQKTGKLHVWII